MRRRIVIQNNISNEIRPNTSQKLSRLTIPNNKRGLLVGKTEESESVEFTLSSEKKTYSSIGVRSKTPERYFGKKPHCGYDMKTMNKERRDQ